MRYGINRRDAVRVIRIMAILLTCWMLAPLSATAEVEDDERLKRGVVRIAASMPQGVHQEGSGVVVGRTPNFVYVVTAAHVVEGARNISAAFYDLPSTPLPARLLAMEGGEDQGLAVLIVRLPANSKVKVNVLPLASDAVARPGDAVSVLGFPRSVGVPWTLTRGELVGRKGRGVVFTANIDAGNSGGPLIRDDQVIGIVTQTLGSVSHAVPVLIARYILESWGVGFRVRLRSKPASLPLAYVAKTVRDLGFSHPYDLTKKGLSGSSLRVFQHEYEQKGLSGAKIVIDHATGLMWQQDGSKDYMTREDADKYIKSLNQQGLAGFKDWRLPTTEELGSLLEPLGANERLYISNVFTPLIACWTADDITLARVGNKEDTYYVDEPVYVDFSGGSIDHVGTAHWVIRHYIRAVRTHAADGKL